MKFLKLAAVMFLCVALVPIALAEQDPPGCYSSSIGTSFSVRHPDGSAATNRALQEGSTVYYIASLYALGFPYCNFQGGTLELITPDGVSHDVTPATGIPTVAVNYPFMSTLVPYTVSGEDVSEDGLLYAKLYYRNGISMMSQPAFPVSTNMAIANQYDSTPDLSQFCFPIVLILLIIYFAQKKR